MAFAAREVSTLVVPLVSYSLSGPYSATRHHLGSVKWKTSAPFPSQRALETHCRGNVDFTNQAYSCVLLQRVAARYVDIKIERS